MRIVIDMQGAQTESRFRGIGRYTLSFAQAVIRNRGEHEIILVLSGLFPDTIEPIRATFEGLLSQDNIRVWYAPGPVKAEQSGNKTRQKVAELIREAFIASLQPDIVHITSLFEGYVDDAVTSIGYFDKVTPVSVTLYDLIPLLNPEQYLKPNPNYESFYLQKIESLNKAKLMLAISNYAKQEAMGPLVADDNRIVAVSTAIEDHFKKCHISVGESQAVFDKFSITRSFILYTGGADERKNLPRLIQAYAALNKELRKQYQLVFAGKMPEGEVTRFKTIATRCDLQPHELIFTGYITDDELVILYNMCKLYVFPSWHEGFGLPALEAMACGAPVIGANTTSLPEVISLDTALFNPFDVVAMTEKINQALTNDEFRQQLNNNAYQQVKKFSWDLTAARAIKVWQKLYVSAGLQEKTQILSKVKPRLAFVSPLPLERTGIADYSAELLPALSKYYDIELVVDQKRVDIELFEANDFKVRDVAWLRANAQSIDRVLYQIGNSPFHKHMLSLIIEIPGTVVLHDFYASGLMAWLEQHGGITNVWSTALYESHGYSAVCDRYKDVEEAKHKYPVNWSILQHAQGIIVHSRYSCNLAQQWYGMEASTDWKVIPLLRSPRVILDKQMVRKQLNIGEDDFVVCSFGFMDASKLNHRLIQAWLSSDLSVDKHCHLIFVGENHGGDYGHNLLKMINISGLKHSIQITGFVSSELYSQYLTVADIAVQLRTHSRGETSAAVLDSMNYGLPLIVNANGSMAELNKDAVSLLPDEFTNDELVEALELLWHNKAQRVSLSENSKKIISEHHSPEKCASKYVDAIEHFYSRNKNAVPDLISLIAKQANFMPNDSELIQFSEAIATTLPLPQPAKRIFIDITATCASDLKTGIERVARALTIKLINAPLSGYRVEPVYLSKVHGQWCYIYARQYTSQLLNIPEDVLCDEIVDIDTGDIILGLDISGSSIIDSVESGYIGNLRAKGVRVYFMVHDLIPIRIPSVFPPNADESHAKWLSAIATTDGIIGVTKHVAEDFNDWVKETNIHASRLRHFKIAYSHHGADIDSSVPTKGIPPKGEKILAIIQQQPSFLIVGTIEPRKGYLQTLVAFEVLWQKGVDVNLIIVGNEGWSGLPSDMRRDIPETITRLRDHPENGKRLFWLKGISDEYLEKIYDVSTCLIAASYEEGFGLPLIEAAQYKLPIIARDIPVFREVAGDHAFYFDAKAPDELASAIQDWLVLYEKNEHPTSVNMPWLTWEQSANQLLKIILDQP
jgi:glycosyltransferase involved in cell wall biosynthesis